MISEYDYLRVEGGYKKFVMAVLTLTEFVFADAEQKNAVLKSKTSLDWRSIYWMCDRAAAGVTTERRGSS